MVAIDKNDKILGGGGKVGKAAAAPKGAADTTDSVKAAAAEKCAAVKCAAVKCAAVKCAAVKCAAVKAAGGGSAAGSVDHAAKNVVTAADEDSTMER